MKRKKPLSSDSYRMKKLGKDVESFKLLYGRKPRTGLNKYKKKW